jgi:hypothetical protein
METKKAPLLQIPLQPKPYQMGSRIQHRGSKHNFERPRQKIILL